MTHTSPGINKKGDNSLMANARALQHPPIFDLDVAQYAAHSRLQDLIVSAMQEQHVNRKALAARLGVSPARVSQMLKADNNIGLDSAVEALYALGKWLDIDIVPL